MKYLKFQEFKINELLASREDLISVNKEDIKNPIEPALMTQDEYYNIVNPNDKWHDQDSYDFYIDGKGGGRDYIQDVKGDIKLVQQKQIGKVKIDYYIRKEKTTYGYFKIPDPSGYGGKDYTYYTDEEKKEKNLPLYNFTVFAVHKDEGLIVGAGQDEWGAVLIWVFGEYRGMGIGEEITKLYRSYYPSNDSGGFTIYGYNQIKKYHAYLVRKYLENGIYSDMVKKGEITAKRVKEITDSIKDVKRFSSGKNSTNPLTKYYGDTKTAIYLGDNYVIIYDIKLIKKNDLSIDPSIEELVYGKAIKAYISVRYNENGFEDILMMYSLNKDYFKSAFEFISSMFPDGLSNRFFISDKNKHGIKELNWINELVESGKYSTEKFEMYKGVEYYDITKIKKPIPNIQEIKKYTQKKLKEIDPYEEGFNIMIETAEDKWFDYAQNNIADYNYSVAIKQLKNHAEENPEWFNKNVTPHNFDHYFKSYFGEDNWSRVPNRKATVLLDKANREYQKLYNKYKNDK